ncbi:MAG: type II/IV secretion system ATPase subunit [Candidatus Woesearchaeota archaeon]|nr:type II/IV secretion system ATPase subunit [Candidatus Woesearchaeota archaeon]
MPEKEVWNYEVLREGEEIILRVDCSEIMRAPSIEDDPVYMAKVIETLAQIKNATKILLYQKRDYEYSYEETKLLLEIARLYDKLMREKDYFSMEALTFDGKCPTGASQRFAYVQNMIFRKLKEDPVSTYVELKRKIRDEKLNMQKSVHEGEIYCTKRYIALLSYVYDLIEKTRLINLVKNRISGLAVGDREIYRNIFHPIIKPDFMFTKLMANYPQNGEEIDNYKIGDNTEVTIFKFPDNVKYLYHLMPPEFKLSEEKYEILDLARNIMAEHKPTRSEFVNPERMREVFYNIGHDLIEELLETRNMKMTQKEIDELTDILVRYTVGFGLIEVILKDEKIQDISINSPMGRTPMFIVHGDYADCYTNVSPTIPEAESWASKLRMMSGRPLDEANPVLDTELLLPGASTRVAVISPPLNPTGLAYSFRRHRDKPWTLPLFIQNKMITPTTAGLLSFVIDGTRSLLIAGTRSSGKSSFLSGLMVEIMRRFRIITIEDTLELPTPQMRHLGFNIQSMKVASALAKGSSEVNAADGIRTTLRLGDSSLIIGEVRSKEALALYEAMRIGAAANVVAGTIHGDSPYGVFDRVVNDIGVPTTSFKATDLIIVANPIKSIGGTERKRRITQITEVRKHWKKDPMAENGFVDLMKYDSKTDDLAATDDLINGDSDVLKAIAANIPEFAGDWDAMWQNIEMRGNMKAMQVSYADRLKQPELLEAMFTIRCNDRFHMLSEKVKKDVGAADPKRIMTEWEIWLKTELKKRDMK